MAKEQKTHDDAEKAKADAAAAAELAAAQERAARAEAALAEAKNQAAMVQARAEKAEEALADTEVARDRADADARAARAALEAKQAEVELRIAGLKEHEVATFYLTERRFLKQVGQPAPRMVYGSHKRPARVRLPAKVLRKTKENPEGILVDQPEDPFLKRIKPAPLRGPEPPTSAAGITASSGPPPGGRAADR